MNEENPGPILLCGAHTVVLYCDGDFNWLGQVLGWGGEGFDPSLAVLIALQVECLPVTQATRVRSPPEANLMHGIQCLFDPLIQDPE